MADSLTDTTTVPELVGLAAADAHDAALDARLLASRRTRPTPGPDAAPSPTSARARAPPPPRATRSRSGSTTRPRAPPPRRVPTTTGPAAGAAARASPRVRSPRRPPAPLSLRLVRAFPCQDTETHAQAHVSGRTATPTAPRSAVRCAR